MALPDNRIGFGGGLTEQQQQQAQQALNASKWMGSIYGPPSGKDQFTCQVTVVDEGNNPLDQITVELIQPTTATSYTKVTGANGIANFAGTFDASYGLQVLIITPGYVPALANAVQVSAGNLAAGYAPLYKAKVVLIKRKVNPALQGVYIGNGANGGFKLLPNQNMTGKTNPDGSMVK